MSSSSSSTIVQRQPARLSAPTIGVGQLRGSTGVQQTNLALQRTEQQQEYHAQKTEQEQYVSLHWQRAQQAQAAAARQLTQRSETTSQIRQPSYYSKHHPSFAAQQCNMQAQYAREIALRPEELPGEPVLEYYMENLEVVPKPFTNPKTGERIHQPPYKIKILTVEVTNLTSDSGSGPDDAKEPSAKRARSRRTKYALFHRGSLSLCSCIIIRFIMVKKFHDQHQVQN